ncbi:uncharacterized protein LOC132266244 [Cornus florida]|uniref:uncharacterized protein LOC132266244 n=1 Tax=Cornus florida TaxID=4283 RepID=UPI00289E4BB2|nr:uncharacterized protein LOC132266244 [Cornus florida]
MGLEDASGIWCDSKEDIRNISTTYFKDLYSSSPIANDIEFWSLVETKVTTEMNLELLKPANRLKKFLLALITKNQTAFVPNRLIHDNIVIAHELLHVLKTKKMKFNFLALKLDMAKAYDRVSSVSYFLKINRECGSVFQPSKGLRQGDPISPYLFLFCTEGLSLLLQEAERKKQIQGCSLGSDCSAISHLLFADDVILFCQAIPSQAESLKDILTRYGLLTGQLVNFDKSSLFFSSDTPLDTRDNLRRILEIRNVNWINSYLASLQLLGNLKLILSIT